MDHSLLLAAGLAVVFFISTVIFLYNNLKLKKIFKPFVKIVNLANEEEKILSSIEQISSKYSQLKNIADLYEEKGKLDKEIESIKEKFNKMRMKYVELEKATLSLEAAAEVYEFGLYESKYDLGSSEKYKVKLDSIRNEQKEMIRKSEACVCDAEWTISGSRSEGKKATNRTIKLALNAFNIECDNLILKVKYNNHAVIKDKILKHTDKIRKLIEPWKCDISNKFVDLKLKELDLVHEYNEKLYKEKEEQKAIQDQMREEAKALKEYEAAKAKAEKEEKDYEKALSKARKEAERSSEEEKAVLLDQIFQLELKLQEAKENKARAISMAEQTKRGHVYVISNIGSFGENVYKIGMTRRLDPQERVKELGDASVPFIFDVHAMIFSEDAPSLEKELHSKFDRYKVNMVNSRKEFFRVDLGEVRAVCDDLGVEVDFTMTAEARDFRETISIIKSEESGSRMKVERSSLLTLTEEEAA